MPVIEKGRSTVVCKRTGKFVANVTFLSEPEDVKRDIINWMKDNAMELEYVDIMELDELMQSLDLIMVPYVEDVTWTLDEIRLSKLISVIMQMSSKGLDHEQIFTRVKQNLK
jgi:hypothetical protein